MSFPPKEHIDAAVEAGEYWFAKTGVYSFPSFRLAQTGIESANGTAISGEHNYWGVKANKAQIAAGKYKVCLTHEVINGKSVPVYAKFASYDSLKDGYIKQAELLVTSSYYEASRHDNNPDQYAIDVAVHYATAPNYAQIVIAYMKEHDLYRYDDVSHLKSIDIKLKPPITEQHKTQAPIVTGAVVAGATVAIAGANGFAYSGIVFAGLVVVGICGALALAKYRQAHQVLQKILTPPDPEKMPAAVSPTTAPVAAPTAAIASS